MEAPVRRSRWTAVCSPLLLVMMMLCRTATADIWEKDVGKDIEIGPSAKGWSSVTLTCRSDVLKVRLVFPESFKGVVYTRGNYGEESPCMSDPEGETEVEMTLPNTVCNVIQDEMSRNTTLVVQHDDFLIFEGDTAFQLGCRVHEDRYLASIDLASPDPGAVPLPESRRSTVSSDSGTVTFRPDQVRPESLVGTKAPSQLKIEPGEVRPDPTASEPPRTARATVQKVEL
ncbi:uncharacterized protein LOC122383407 [Amphibalanus amphitrite]|uniref:uncharacterized protein LOC122383407 n=1 Tax=Amphibalanus amphitrite TaxID=1232801 RepID=UPI001C91EF5D|nr:uncharacterized protein LOC122383407 [Amphibalanus amphitrite]